MSGEAAARAYDNYINSIETQIDRFLNLRTSPGGREARPLDIRFTRSVGAGFSTARRACHLGWVPGEESLNLGLLLRPLRGRLLESAPG